MTNQKIPDVIALTYKQRWYILFFDLQWTFQIKVFE